MIQETFTKKSRQLAPFLFVLFAVTMGCKKDLAPVLRVEIGAQNQAAVPDLVSLVWLGAADSDNLQEDARISKDDYYKKNDQLLGTIEFALREPRLGIRRVLARGFRDHEVVSVAAGLIELEDYDIQTIYLELSTAWADSDGDGVPDVIDAQCLIAPSSESCRQDDLTKETVSDAAALDAPVAMDDVDTSVSPDLSLPSSKDASNSDMSLAVEQADAHLKD